MEISSSSFNLGTNHSEEIRHNYNDYKKYYEFIKYIEMNSNVKFQTYNKCSERNLTVAYYIVSFLEHKPINIRCKGGVEFSTKNLICDDGFVECAKNKQHVTIVSTDNKEKHFSLNGHTFIIPYTHNVFSSCTVTKIKKGRKGMMEADIKFDGDYYMVLFSSKPTIDSFLEGKEIQEV